LLGDGGRHEPLAVVFQPGDRLQPRTPPIGRIAVFAQREIATDTERRIDRRKVTMRILRLCAGRATIPCGAVLCGIPANPATASRNRA
jgi:hypothetical protein